MFRIMVGVANCTTTEYSRCRKDLAASKSNAESKAQVGLAAYPVVAGEVNGENSLVVGRNWVVDGGRKTLVRICTTLAPAPAKHDLLPASQQAFYDVHGSRSP